MNLKLLHYNNYFNRKLKIASLDEYLALPGDVFANINFIPNDGIETKQIINTDAPRTAEYDYLVCFENNEIVSRWFVMECVRLRSAQYELTLKRDVLADNYEDIKNAPVFVEKGHLENEDPMICNDEGMRLNQIKVDEELMYQFGTEQFSRDNSRPMTPWIVGYVDKTMPQKSIQVSADDETEYATVEKLSAISGIPELVIASMINLPGTTSNSTQLLSKFRILTGIGTETDLHIDYSLLYNSGLYSSPDWSKDNVYVPELGWRFNLYDKSYAQHPLLCTIDYSSDTERTLAQKIFKLTTNELKDILNNSLFEGHTQYHINGNELELLREELASCNNLLRYQGVTYIVEIVQNDHIHEVTRTISASSAVIQNTLKRNVEAYGGTFNNNYTIEIPVHSSNLSLNLSETVQGNVNITLSGTRKSCSGSPCDIFAIPFGAIGVGHISEGFLQEDFVTTADKQFLLNVASAISKELGQQLYDIQILPYCPIPMAEDYYEKLVVNVPAMQLGIDYNYIVAISGSTTQNISIVYWLREHNLTFYWNKRLTVSDPKIESQTDMLRICSPNGQGFYDMNVAKNGGLTGFNINVSYKPFTPYIQITPRYNFIYGQTFDKDYRGLICGGDFSMSQLQNEWQTYQLNNKNYQNIFAREIQSLDVQQDYARFKSMMAMPGAIIGGGVSGALTGAKAGPYGAIAGAVAGVTVGAVSSGLGYQKAEAVRLDQKDYAIDKYEYDLGNIRARPDTLTKLDTFNTVSKYVPFLEYYSCTETEKEALRNKIKYNGMTVQRIGTISEFRNVDEPHFFKGQLIMDEGETLYGDNHLLNAIYDELIKGVYL